MNVRKSITINRPREDLYRFWQRVENLPAFMSHLESVRDTGEGRSHWQAKGPVETTVEWDAEITEDRPNELIAWQSLPGAGLKNSGAVHFAAAPGHRGTEVAVELAYDMPAGAVGAAVAKLFGSEPGKLIQQELRALKQIMETGEVLHSDASIHSGAHAAQPSAGR